MYTEVSYGFLTRELNNFANYIFLVDGVGVPTQTPAVTTAPASTVTLYQVYQATPSGPQSGEIVGTSILDIGTNSAGTETTISVGQFISISESSEVLAATTITLPAEVLYSNCKMNAFVCTVLHILILP